jgi:hypothetical protein
MRVMATVTTTFFFITDTRATDRSVSQTWSPPPATSSQPGSWQWATR